jgi:hypothetical protein
MFRWPNFLLYSLKANSDFFGVGITHLPISKRIIVWPTFKLTA